MTEYRIPEKIEFFVTTEDGGKFEYRCTNYMEPYKIEREYLRRGIPYKCLLFKGLRIDNGRMEYIPTDGKKYKQLMEMRMKKNKAYITEFGAGPNNNLIEVEIDKIKYKYTVKDYGSDGENLRQIGDWFMEIGRGVKKNARRLYGRED